MNTVSSLMYLGIQFFGHQTWADHSLACVQVVYILCITHNPVGLLTCLMQIELWSI